ncbi:MAG: sigma-70 family RNA polymerase sigma factor [Polyangiales bacterium]
MDAAAFARERAYLVRVAYRLTGSVAAAEDCVQEAWLRAHARDDVEAPRAFLTTVVTRVALDAMRAERRRRRAYEGPWLPEPLPTGDEEPDRHDSLSVAFLVLLEALRPRERAVFVLHEVLDVPMPEVARAVGRREDACRQLLRRARATLAAREGRAVIPSRVARDTASRLWRCLATGDLDGLCALLADDVEVQTDHGGRASAARRTVRGRDAASRFLHGLSQKGLRSGVTASLREVNGALALVVRDGAAVVTVLTPEVTAAGVRAVWIVRNPEKLARLALADDLP